MKQAAVTRLLPAVLCALLLHAGGAHASQRAYVGYCAAPDGTRFVLRARYTYSHFVVARSPIVDQQDWQVYLLDRRGREIAAPVELPFIDQNLLDCARIGVLDGHPVVHLHYLRADGTWFPTERLPAQLTVSGTRSERSEAMNAALDRWQVSPASFALVAPHGPRLVYEQAMFSFTPAGEGIVSAVYQSSSTDDGRTWTPPILSASADNFDIGKPLSQQRYAARSVAGGTVNPRAITQ